MMQPELKIVDDPVEIAAVPIGLLTTVWPMCVPHIKRVVDRAAGDITLSGIYGRLMAGDNLLITISQGGSIIAANTVEVRVTDSGTRMLFLPVVSGVSVDVWVDQYMAAIIGIAKDMGCTELRGSSIRKGWVRKLAQMGYHWSHVHDVLGLKIED